MRSRNSKPLTRAEFEHMGRVKELPCSCCAGPGGFAHHIVQGYHFATVGLCYDCHQGPNGWHGNKSLWRIYKHDELSALNVTLQRLNERGRG